MNFLAKKFSFAGFNFPRYIPEFSKSRFDKRTFRCVYYHAPEPLTGGIHPGRGFYLDDHGSPSRWVWCDEVIRIEHTGWYCDEQQDDKIRGLVVRLTHGRYLIGWSMGEGMASEIDGYIYTDARSAALAADSMAERAAEREREYQDAEYERIRIEEENQGDDAEETEGY